MPTSLKRVAYDIAAAGDYVYVADGPAGLIVLRLDNAVDNGR